MCGIVGKLNFEAKNPVDLELIKRMALTLEHRGPDGDGFYIEGNIGLGHKRLSIIDLTDAGRQPMANEDKTIWIVFNGEVYNFEDLKKELVRKGHKFVSRTDTEVILHLYEDLGESCLRYLRGMFAFAIWDGKKKKLFLARDRVGKKPLCYFSDNRSLIFASEMKAILEDPQVAREVNFEALHYFLTYHYVPTPLTAFKNIFKLPPAHFLVWQNGQVRIERYWRLDFSKKRQIKEEEAKEEILERLKEAVKIRMVSDVSLGVFLSGGADSSAITALMSQFSKKPVRTFSVGFKESFFNELPYAKKVARLFKTDHHELTIEPKALEVLPQLVWHYGEPYGDSSAVLAFYIAKLTRNYVTVALNGDGGDENFAGYRRYYLSRLMTKYAKAPLFSKNLLGQLSKLLPLTSSVKVNLFLQKSKMLSKIGLLAQPERHLWLIYWFNYGIQDMLYTAGFKKELQGFDLEGPIKKAYEQFGSASGGLLEQMMAVEFNTYLPDDLLVKMDIACMANSLEPRSPLLDHKFMEFTASLPADFKIKGQVRKYIFKKALEQILPKEIIYRKKMGFTPPVDDWFRGQMKDFAGDILLSQKAIQRGYFEKKKIEKLLSEHLSGKMNRGEVIWALLFLEIWHQTFIDKNGWN